MLSAARIATLVCFLVIAAVELSAAVYRHRTAGPSATFVPESGISNFRYVVKQSAAGSALHPGDHIEILAPFDLAAYQFQALAVGSTFNVRRTAPLAAEPVAVPIVPKPGFKFQAALILLEAMFLGVAALIAARGRASGSLSLAWLLALIVLLVNPLTAAWPRPLIFGYAFLSFSFAALALLCASDFASRLAGNPQASWARSYRRVARSAAIISVLVNVNLSFVGYFKPTTPLALQYAAAAGQFVQVVCLLVGLGLAFAKAPANDRQRVSWVAISLGVGIIGFVCAIIAENVGIAEPWRDVPLLLLLAMPLGCAYAILRYRLLDIGFVVNRATVFGVTSLLLLAALALVDFGLQSLLGSWLMRTGIYVQLGLALAIGIATRPIHERVDRVVDDLFFRQRHEAERALRRFAREVAFIDDAEVVVERTIETIERSANLRCTLFMSDAAGDLNAAANGAAPEVASIDRNDPGVVRLLSTREPVDLHGVESALRGDYAFPMFARNRLLGVVVCGEKADGVAAYAPDELEAIGAVAHATGFALDLLRIEALEREVARLHGAVVGYSASRSATI